MALTLALSPQPAFEIIRYRPEHKAQILNLQRQHWGTDDAKNAAYFAWKYEAQSGSEAPFIYVAMQGHDVIGMRGFWKTAWKVGAADAAIHMMAAGDLVVAHEFRGKGLFPRIMKFAEADLVSHGHRFMINLSAGPATYLLSLRQGWRKVGAYRSLRLQTPRVDIKASVRASLRKVPVLWRYADGEFFQTKNAFRHFDKRPAGRSGIEIDKIPRPEMMARLVRAMEQAGKIALWRDENYFSWRFLNPRHEYRFLFANDGASEGYLVLEARKGASGYGINIVDWEATDSATKKALLEVATEAAHEDSLSVWSTPEGANDHSFLIDAGFREIDLSRGIQHYTPSVLIKPIGGAPPGMEYMFGGLDPLIQKNWNLQMILSDNH